MDGPGMSIHTEISGHPFLEGLDPHHAAVLEGTARSVRFRAGTRIFDEGGPADRFWLLVDGHVQLEARLPERGAVIIESLPPASVLGWSWLFPPYAWHFGATAVANTSAIEFDAEQVRLACDADPALGYELLRRFVEVVVDRLQSTRIRLLDLYGQP
jgi:CRP/FNR family transcriptional regulator, cyclic AMP receptor protein